MKEILKSMPIAEGITSNYSSTMGKLLRFANLTSLCCRYWYVVANGLNACRIVLVWQTRDAVRLESSVGDVVLYLFLLVVC